MGGTLAQRLLTAVSSDRNPPLVTRSFLLVCGTHLLTYGSYAAVNPTFAVFVETVTPSESLIGVAFGVFTFAAMLARPAAGWVLDHVGRRLVQGLAAVAFACATLSFAWATTISAVLVLRGLHGVAWGVASTATPTIAADVVPAERRSEGLAYFGIVPNVAIILLPPAGLWVAHRYGFGTQFAGAALLAVLAVGPLVVLGATAPSSSVGGKSYARDAVPAALLVALASVPVGAVDALLPLYAPTVGLANPGLFFTVMGTAIVAARSTLGRLRRASTAALLSSSFVCECGGLALVALAPRFLVVLGLPLGVLAGAALFGFGFALVFPLLQSVAVAGTAARRTGSATATVLLGMDLGIGLGAVVFGVVADAAGIASAYVVAALVPLSGVVATAGLRPTDRTHG